MNNNNTLELIKAHLDRVLAEDNTYMIDQKDVWLNYMYTIVTEQEKMIGFFEESMKDLLEFAKGVEKK